MKKSIEWGNKDKDSYKVKIMEENLEKKEEEKKYVSEWQDGMVPVPHLLIQILWRWDLAICALQGF